MNNEPVPTEEKPAYTYSDLLAKLQTLTPEQLQQPARYWGEYKGGVVRGLDILDDDYIHPSGDGCEPAGAYRPKDGEEFDEDIHMSEDDIEAELVFRKGTLIFSVD